MEPRRAENFTEDLRWNNKGENNLWNINKGEGKCECKEPGKRKSENIEQGVVSIENTRNLNLDGSALIKNRCAVSSLKVSSLSTKREELDTLSSMKDWKCYQQNNIIIRQHLQEQIKEPIWKQINYGNPREANHYSR
jgi:hypothetical protein